METCIEVKNVTKKYKQKTVVNQLSFCVKRGETFGLLGHNGAGKSTTIEMILGLKKPEEGTATILGMNAYEKRKEIFQKVGVQLQSSSYQNAIRVEEICREISLLYKKPLDYHILLKQFGLDSLMKVPVSKLSGGEKQKLSLVLALIPSPEIIFLDELTTGLDVAARREVWRILNELKRKGTTIFLTTHYMEEVQSLCDRICLIKEGKKVIEGTVEEVISTSPYQQLEEAYLWFMGNAIEKETLANE